MGYGLAISAIAGGVGGALSGIGSNNTRQNILGAYAQGNFPQVPDLENEYMSGYFREAQMQPQLLAYEHALRSQYAPREAQQALDLYNNFAPRYAATQHRLMEQFDPQFTHGRQQLYNAVSGDLSAGYGLTPGMQDQIEGGVRGAQAARGNYLGNANVSAEAFAEGTAGQALHQSRIGNMQAFINGKSPQDFQGGILGPGGSALGITQGTLASPNYAYTEPLRGLGQTYFNAAQTQFQDAEGQAQFRASGLASAPAEQNPWLSSLSGAAGALSGGSGGGGSHGSSMSSFGSMFGGGGSQQNVSWNPSYNAMMG